MTAPVIRFFFDYVDPLSYLQEQELQAVEHDAGKTLAERVPLELRAPPEPLLEPDDDEWRRRWHTAHEIATRTGTPLTLPSFLPWTRKAHELVLHAVEKGFAAEARRALFRGVFAEGADIGRVDVLVDLARTLGMAATEAKIVLDVDRYASAVLELRREASRVGISEPPAIWHDGRALQGFHNRNALRTFLRSP